MKAFLKSEWPTFVLYALALVLAVWTYPRLPESVPVHWGPDGQPDRYGSRFEALFLMPLLLLPGIAITYAVEAFSPRDRSNAAVLRVARFGLAGLVALNAAAQAFDWPMSRSIIIGIGVLFTLLGNVMAKAQPSAFVGLRTPWTMSSRKAWYAGQRRSAVWFVAFGLLLTVSAIVLPEDRLFPWVVPYGLMGGLVLKLFWLTYASYLDWRRDPNPEPVLRHK